MHNDHFEFYNYLSPEWVGLFQIYELIYGEKRIFLVQYTKNIIFKTALEHLA